MDATGSLWHVHSAPANPADRGMAAPTPLRGVKSDFSWVPGSELLLEDTVRIGRINLIKDRYL